MLPEAGPQVESSALAVFVGNATDEVFEAAAVDAAVDDAVDAFALGVYSAPAEVLYQLALGSPRHSPTVTGLNPAAIRVFSM